MKILSTLVALALVPTVVLFAGAPVVMTGNTFCTAAGFGAVNIDGNLVVPAGIVCTLTDTTVTGDVKVQPGGALRVRGADIGGHVKADGAAWIRLNCLFPTGATCIANPTTLGGNVQIKRTTGIECVGLESP